MRATVAALFMSLGVPVGASDPVSAWAAAARAHDLDPVVLYAIALQESRTLWTDGLARPWPWTLRSARDGTRRYTTAEAATEALEALLAAGERNVDVGLMQINWAYHHRRVAEPSALLDPRRNIGVGAAILGEALEASHGDLDRALGAYHHDPDSERARRYSAQVRRRLEALRALPGLAQRLAAGTADAAE